MYASLLRLSLFQTGPSDVRPLQEIRWNTSKLASNNPHRLRRATITDLAEWISSRSERSETNWPRKGIGDFEEILFKIHLVFGDRWNIIKKVSDGWEPTKNWTIDVKFCLRWNRRRSNFVKWNNTVNLLSATLGHLRWHHGRHSQMCLHTSEGQHGQQGKLSHWVLKYSKLWSGVFYA